MQQVREAAPAGGPDQFQPLLGLPGDGTDPDDDGAIYPTSVLTLTGVMLVDQQRRALVQSPTGSAVLCIGADGRCAAGDLPALTEILSVQDIYLKRGCLQLVQGGVPREVTCLR